MPKKRKNKKISFATRKELLSAPDSYKSLAYGILTVIVFFILGFSLTKMLISRPNPSVDNGAVSVEKIKEAIEETKKYTVKEGDTLWSIAEEKYGSGFEWYRIANENKIEDENNLEEGTKLVIPEIEQEEKTSSEKAYEEISITPAGTAQITEAPQGIQKSQDGKITDGKYTIQAGDDLWEIAQRAYGNPYKWMKIAEANNLTNNPDLIHIDNTLTIPR